MRDFFIILLIVFGFYSPKVIANQEGEAYLEFLLKKCNEYDGINNDSLQHYSKLLTKKGKMHKNVFYEMKGVSFEARTLILTSNNLEGGVQLFEEGIEKSEKLGEYESLFELRNDLAVCYGYTGDVEKEIELILLNIELAEEHNMVSKAAIAYFNLGSIWYNQENLERAEECLANAIDLMLEEEETGEPHYLKGYTLMALGTVYSQKLDYLKGIGYYKEAQLVFNERNQFNEGIRLEMLIGETYVWDNQLDSAEFYVLSGLSKMDQIDDPIVEVAGYNTAGEIFKGIGQLTKALESYRMSLQISTDHQLMQQKEFALKSMGEVHQMMGKMDSALYYTKEYINIHDSIFTSEKQEIIEGLQIKYETEKKEGELYQAKLRLVKDQVIIKAVRSKIHKAILVGTLLFIASTIAIFLIVLIKRAEGRIMKEKVKVSRIKTEYLNGKAKLLEQKIKNLREEIIRKNEAVDDLSQELDEVLRDQDKKLIELSNMKILTDEDWKRFKFSFIEIFPRFLDFKPFRKKLFTTAEIRLLMLSKITLENKEIANCLGISEGGVRTTKHRIVKKSKELLGVNSFEKLIEELPG